MGTEQSEDPMEFNEDVCKFCKKTLTKPMQSACSDFRFCKDCAESLQKGHEANACCPICKDPKSIEIHKIFRDKAAEKELLTSRTMANHERLATAEDPIDGRLKASKAAMTSTKGFAAVLRPKEGGGIGMGGTQAQGRQTVPVREFMGGAPMQSQIASMKVSLIAEKMLIYDGVITGLCREVKKLTMQLETMERQSGLDKEQMETMYRKVKALERKGALKDVTIWELNLKITAMEQTGYEGTLLWKIADFDLKRQEAISGRQTSIYSLPFYTSKEGYKMCARLYLNGDKNVEGTHVSLFFVIMRGQFDALLKWPFRQEVTLMFLDQSGKDLHVMDAFQPDPTSSSFKRPTTEMNIDSGCPLFMSLTQLFSPLHAFVKDDAAFIKISVCCDNLS